jgi:Vacuolar protein sorting-associated protein 62
MTDLAKALCPLFYFDSKEQFFPCLVTMVDRDNTFTTIADDTPIYYYHDEPQRFITYVVFYQQDGGIHGIGAHKYDIEFVRVFYDQTNLPTNYYLSEHGRDQGMYISHSKVEHDKVTGRPVFYIAKNTHAHYPRSGVWLRGFCCANDVASKHVLWDPIGSLEPITDPTTVADKFGAGHMQWFALPHEIPGAPKNWNFLYRFFYPLSKRLRALP